MIRGFVDSVRINALNDARVEGWACDTEDVSHRLQVRGRIGDRPVGIAIADRSRPDLLQNKIGDGQSGFAVPLEVQLTVEEQDSLIVETKRQDSNDWIVLPERRVNGRRVITKYFQEEAAAKLWADSARSDAFLEERPVFVIGSARSGTSAIFQSLTRATRYRGFFEGHVLDIAAALEEAVSAHYERKSREVPNPHFYHIALAGSAMAREAIHAALRCLTVRYQTLYWADKTPTPQMVRSVPVLAATWPSAKFIFMKRRAIENILSRKRKFRETGFEYNAEYWASTMYAWRMVRDQVQGRYVEIEQMDMLRKPIACASAVAALLELDESETRALGDHLSQHRPEVTDPTARVIGNISETGWGPEEVDLFHRYCDAEMAAYKYTWDERYSENLSIPEQA